MIYRIYATGGIRHNPKAETALCVITLAGGVLAGWSNENVGCAVVAAVVLFMFYYKRRKLVILPHHICGLVGSIVGYSILMLAPGNRVRLENTKYECIFYKHISWSLSQLAVNMFRAIIILVIAAVVVYIFSRVKKIKINWLLPSVYFASGLVSACVLMLRQKNLHEPFWSEYAFGVLGVHARLSGSQKEEVGLNKFNAARCGGYCGVCRCALCRNLYFGILLFEI